MNKANVKDFIAGVQSEENQQKGKMAFIVVCEGEFDQVCETRDLAVREVKWLQNRGMSTKYVVVPWDEQDAFIDSLYE